MNPSLASPAPEHSCLPHTRPFENRCSSHFKKRATLTLFYHPPRASAMQTRESSEETGFGCTFAEVRSSYRFPPPSLSRSCYQPRPSPSFAVEKQSLRKLPFVLAQQHWPCSKMLPLPWCGGGGSGQGHSRLFGEEMHAGTPLPILWRKCLIPDRQY